MKYKILCPRWGRCKATKKCPLSKEVQKKVYVFGKCPNGEAVRRKIKKYELKSLFEKWEKVIKNI